MSETTGEKLELRYVPLEQAVLWERNAKRHDYGAIMKSIQRYGFLDPMKFDARLNNGKGGIVEGNGRATALRDMYMNSEKMPRGILQNGKGWLVPMLFGVDAKSQAMAEAYAVDHNNTTLMGGDFDMLQMASMWESDGYAALLKDLQANDMPPVSMDDGDISALLRGLETKKLAAENDEEHADDLVDKAEEFQKKWKVKLGDVWKIGKHKLYCGDSSDANIKKIFKNTDGICTDPPYDLSTEKIIQACENFSEVAIILSSDRLAFDLAKFWRMSHDFIWKRRQPRSYPTKNLPVLYHSHCLVLTRGENKCGWERPKPDFGSVIELEGNEFELTEMGQGKNIELFVQMMAGFSWRTVAEPFAGTGATIIACEKTNRVCSAVELDPKTCAVALERWIRIFPDKKPIRS